MLDKNNKSIAEKTELLDKLTHWFNSDDFDLEQALEKFKEAESLAEEIERDLRELKNKIEIVKVKFDKVDQ